MPWRPGRLRRPGRGRPGVGAGHDFPLDVPENYRWMTLHQVSDLLEHSNSLNIQARSLLAGLHTTW
ncbi:NDP-hexose 2,3-dehydratase family protein [Dactylosporangium sp. CA-139066]|uniref:NDP-hexose 2,3-dehydratase family protein n=1 Tax=Dactylosporangium sp. CA-139066 TaxID=3239930 RepID=UPI003D8BB25E